MAEIIPLGIGVVERIDAAQETLVALREPDFVRSRAVPQRAPDPVTVDPIDPDRI